MSNIAVKFIQNLKATLDKKKFNEEELKVVFSTMQEVCTLSPLEVISLLDNIQIAIDEAEKDMTQEDLDTLKKELFEEQDQL